MGSQLTFSRASITEMSLIMLSLVGLFSDPNSLCIWELMKCLVFTQIKSRICLSNNLGWMDIDFHAQGCGQARSAVDHIHTEWDISRGDPGISTSSGEKNTGRGVGRVYNRCISQCPCCDEQLDPLTVPNTWCIKELTEIQFFKEKHLLSSGNGQILSSFKAGQRPRGTYFII